MSTINSAWHFNYECCGMPVAIGHSTGCNCKYNVTFPPPGTLTGGTLSAVRRTSKLVTLDKITWHTKVSIVRTRC